ncbi:nose resistant to fluoxetine protein 6 [Uranotaenia lowii]|uniref:nose resistant to fluoxetine protein 6 n=1 Tax=Uranotaenia lowii TaxID=190385 RepID=UPI0024789130|nr:nose resistant to fluoxetine protein 6 [Uranotaenia lowii]
MAQHVFTLIQIGLLLTTLQFRCALTDESYYGKNQSSIAKIPSNGSNTVQADFELVASELNNGVQNSTSGRGSAQTIEQHYVSKLDMLMKPDQIDKDDVIGESFRVNPLDINGTRNLFLEQNFPTTLHGSSNNIELNGENNMVTNGGSKGAGDSKAAGHIYQVHNAKSLRGRSGALKSTAGGDNETDSSENVFHVFTGMYDHFHWNVSAIKPHLSYDCAIDMDIYLQQLTARAVWALKASDSSGRYGGQAFFGNDFWLGSKSFCEEVNQQNAINNGSENFIEMIFFVATIRMKLSDIMPEPTILQIGQCLPKSCSVNDVYKILQEDRNSKIINNMKMCNSSSVNCNKLEIVNLRTVPGSYSLLQDPRFFLLSVALIVVTATVVFATYYERTLMCKVLNQGKKTAVVQPSDDKLNGLEKLFDSDNKTIELNSVHGNNNVPSEKSSRNIESSSKSKMICKLSEILLCFAAGPNSRTILSVDTSSKDSITCVHGLRLYSLLWTIMVHTYLQLFAVGENRFNRKITERSFGYQVVGNATFSVDTFFFISGALIVVLYYRSWKNDNNASTNNGKSHSTTRALIPKMNKITLSVLYRFLRLTPAYLFVIILNELALKWTYEKSVFTPGIIDHITCNKFWWRNILYINNWYPFSEMCMVWSWYLANDMQFYIIAITILVFCSRRIKLSAAILGMLVLVSWIISIHLSIHFNYTYKVAEPFESFDILYDKPWQRITPYIMGMLTGYIYHFKKKPPKIMPALNGLLWFISVAILFALVFGVWNGQLSVPATALYVSLGHTAWGAALIWITLSCCWGYAPAVNSFLSYRGVYPLSRLSYCAYLLHPMIMMATSFQMEAPIHLQHVMVITVFFGNAVLSFILSYFVSLAFEAPVINLLKLAFKK